LASFLSFAVVVDLSEVSFAALSSFAFSFTNTVFVPSSYTISIFPSFNSFTTTVSPFSFFSAAGLFVVVVVVVPVVLEVLDVLDVLDVLVAGLDDLSSAGGFSVLDGSGFGVAFSSCLTGSTFLGSGFFGGSAHNLVT